MSRRICAVYLITNKNNTVLYTGVTSDLAKRVFEHEIKGSPRSFSARYNLNKLVWYETFYDIKQAIVREIKEETGLDVVVKRMFDVIVIRQIVDNKKGIVVFVWFLVEPKNDDVPIANDDLVETKWVSKKEALSYLPDNFIEHIPWNVKESLVFRFIIA